MMENFSNALLKKNSAVHAIFCTIGLLGIFLGVAKIIGHTVNKKLNLSIAYTPIMHMISDPTKIGVIIEYIFFITILFLCFILTLYLEKNKRLTMTYNLFNTSFLALFNISLFLIYFYTPNPKIFVLALATLLWILFTILPFLTRFLDFQFLSVFLQLIKRIPLRFFSYIASGVLVLIITQLFLFFYPYLGFSNLKVANDYFGIPEQTYINNRLVDNNTYMKANHIGGLYTTQKSIGNLIQNPVSEYKIYSTKTMKSSVTIFNKLMDPYLTTKERWYLSDITDSSQSSHNLNVNLGSEKNIFENENAYEIATQLIAGHYFHHQNALLAPLNGYYLGQPKNQITFLYGFGNTLILTKLMSLFGSYTFQAYTHALFTFYPLYYFLLFVLSCFLFRDVVLVLFVMLLCVSGLQILGFEAVRFAPGDNPLRHFFDLFVIGGFFLYLRAQSYRWLFLSLSFAFALLTVWCDKEFGTIIFTALSITFLIQLCVSKTKKIDLVVFAVALIAAAKIGLFLMSLGSDPLAVYGILGVSVAPTSPHVLLAIFVLLSLSYFAFFYAYKMQCYKEPWFYLAIFLFLYFQGMMVYYVWYTEPGHFLSACWIPLVLLLGLFLKRFMLVNSTYLLRQLLVVTTFAIFIFVYLPSLLMYTHTSKIYQKIFDTHQVYHWHFSRASFLTTMDPTPFDNSIKLINKYDKNTSVYMISRYDNFLPFLSGKYLAFPYPQLDVSIVSKKEFDTVVGAIAKNKPKYIFIDTDIESNHFSDVLNPNSSLALKIGENAFNLSAGRMLILMNLRNIFDVVRNSYHKIATGDLISVYERNNLKRDATR